MSDVDEASGVGIGTVGARNDGRAVGARRAVVSNGADLRNRVDVASKAEVTFGADTADGGRFHGSVGAFSAWDGIDVADRGGDTDELSGNRSDSGRRVLRADVSKRAGTA